jgi:hypothetical protein
MQNLQIQPWIDEFNTQQTQDEQYHKLQGCRANAMADTPEAGEQNEEFYEDNTAITNGGPMPGVHKA